jgi:hypothetical protein
MDRNPLTPRAKKVIEYAMEEARNLNHHYVGSEHILLGLVREEKGAAAQVLMNLGLRLETVRAEIRAILGRSPEHEESRADYPQYRNPLNDTSDNPYQSPRESDRASPRAEGRRSRPGLILAAFLWLVVMLFALPALTAPRHGQPRQPIEFQVVTALITALVLAGLARSVSGWRHLLVTPLWLFLIFAEYLAWIWPNRPW